MKLKLVNVLTVGLVTLAVLSPELVVLGVVLERHMEFAQIQNLDCKVNQPNEGKLTFFPKHKGTVLEQARASNKIFNVNFFEQFLTSKEGYKIVKIWQRIFLLIPIILGMLAFSYDRYLMYRAAVFKQQVEMLERLWQESIEQ